MTLTRVVSEQSLSKSFVKKVVLEAIASALFQSFVKRLILADILIGQGDLKFNLYQHSSF